MFCSPSGGLLQNVPAQEAAKSSSGRGSAGPQPCRAASTPQAPLPAPCGPRPKPKTVSELLREKRLREARARKAAQGPVVLPPQLLVSPVILQPPLPLASHGIPATGPAIPTSALSGPGAPAAASPSTSGSWASAKDKGPPTLQALAIAPASTVAVKAPADPAASRAPALGPGQVPLSCPLSNLGQSQAPATSRKQGLPESPPFLPAAPSPTQLPVHPLSLTPALGTHRSGPHMAASAPLPVTLVLTAQGLLSVPMPAVVGLSKPAGTPDPKGLLVTLSSSVTETQAGQGLFSTDTESEPLSRTDLVLPSTPLPSQSPAEVDSDKTCASRGLSSPGEAQVAGETGSQAALLADHPKARPNQLPPRGSAGPENGLGGTLESPTEQGETRGPPDLERHATPRLGPEKGALDLGLLSQESEVAVREWLRGQQGVCVSPLRSRLPYQPPTLCSLRTLSGLLLHKKALEHRAASLAAPRGAAGALQPSLGQLQCNPAYLLLKARFLATFTLPALLATLPPHGVPTTLSAAMSADPESEDAKSEDDGLGQPGCRASSSPQEGPAATAPVQVGGCGHRALAPLPCPPPRAPLPACGVWPAQSGGGGGWGQSRWKSWPGEPAGRFLGRRKLAPSSPVACRWCSHCLPFRPVWELWEKEPRLTWGDPQLLPGLQPCLREKPTRGSVLPPYTHAPHAYAWAGSPARALCACQDPSRHQLWHHPRQEAAPLS